MIQEYVAHGTTEVDEDGNIVEIIGDDENSIFIAFQYPRKLPQTFYRQSDPEWQEFVKFSFDEERKNAVRGTTHIKFSTFRAVAKR